MKLYGMITKFVLIMNLLWWYLDYLVCVWIPRPLLRFVFHVFFFFFFVQPAIVDDSTMNNARVHCSRVPQITLFSNFFFKNGSHNTIHTFKNYFRYSVFSFQFQQNKFYPNGPLINSFLQLWWMSSLNRFKRKPMFGWGNY